MANPSDAYTPDTWLLDGGGAARRLDPLALEHWTAAEGQLWIHLDEPNAYARTWLEKDSGVPSKFQRLILEHRTGPRAIPVGNERLLLLMRVSDPDAGESLVQSAPIVAWIERRRVITICSSSLPEVRELTHLLADGRGPKSASEVPLGMVGCMATRLADAVVDLRTVESELEAALEQKQGSLSNQIRHFRRRVAALQRFAGPQRALLLRLRGLDLDWLWDDDADDWNGVITHFDEGSQELDSILADSRSLQDALDSAATETLNRRIYLLTVVSVVFLPLSLITDILGMNIATRSGNILGASHPSWFAAVIAGLLLLSWVVVALLRRRDLL